MRYNKTAGIILLALITLIVLANSFYITPLTISDSDPTTYIIVPVLMLPLFALFLAKEDMQPSATGKDFAVGIALFILFMAATIYTRLSLSYIFLDFRIDLLLLPILLASVAVLLFGLRNINKFKWFLLYAVFASPAVLIFIVGLNLGFASANTQIIYSIIKLIFHGATYIPPVTITAKGYAVGIGETCVGVGILTAIIFFLAPIAYLYNGTKRNKFLWLLSAFLLMLLLNFLRMLFITIDWFANGPSNALLTVHLFVGILLFYISIIAMMLVSGWYRLSIPVPRRANQRRQQRRQAASMPYGAIAAIMVAIIFYAATLNLQNAAIVSPAAIYNHALLNFSSATGGILINQTTAAKGYTFIISTEANGSATAIEATNATVTDSKPIIITLTSTKQYLPSLEVSNAILLGRMSFIDNTSQLETVYYLQSRGEELFLYNKIFPYVVSEGSAATIDEYVVVPASALGSASCGSYYHQDYSSVLNIAQLNAYNASTQKALTSAYCDVQKLVG